MVKHTQTIFWQIADNLFECVWPFCKIGAKRVNFFLFSFLKYHDFMFFVISKKIERTSGK